MVPETGAASASASCRTDRLTTIKSPALPEDIYLSRGSSIDKIEDPPLSGIDALVAELVDALVSGTSGESRGGSSPLLGTKYTQSL